MKTTYLFNQTTKVNPLDRKSVYVEVNYDNEAIINQSYPQVGIKNLRFAREDVSLFYNWVKNNNYGIFYAPYFDIILSKGSNSYDIPLYLDLTDGFKTSNDGVEVSIKLYQSLDWLNDIVDSFTFESIVQTFLSGDNVTPQIKDAYYYIQDHTLYIPYIISTIPNYLQAFTALSTTVAMVLNIIHEVDQITCIFAPGAAGFFTTVPAVIGFILHLVFLALKCLAIYTTYIHTIFSIIQPIKYHAAMLLYDLMVTACIYMGLEFQSSIFQQFPFNQVALLPEKYIPVANGSSMAFSIAGYLNTNNLVGGYTAPNPSQMQSYPIMTGGDIFRMAKKLVNGKILLQTISGKPTLILERRDYVPVTPKYQLPDIREDWNGYNTKEFFATTILSFAKDLNDKNTYDQYPGQKLSAVVLCTNQPDPLCTLTKGLREITIDAARGIRKEQLTLPENIANDFFDAINAVGAGIEVLEQGIIDVVNGIISIWDDIIKVLYDLGIIDRATKNKLIIKTLPPATNPFGALDNIFDKRIGMLQMEHDLVNVPKLLLLDFENMYTSWPYDILNPSFSGYNCYPLHSGNASILNTLYLWNFFYDIDCWCPVGSYALPTYTSSNGTSTPPPPTADVGKHNQFTLWEPALNKSSDKNKLDFAYQDFTLIKDDNNFNDMNGNPCIIDSLGWHFEENWADLQYRRNEIYTGNLTATITLPNGE